MKPLDARNQAGTDAQILDKLPLYQGFFSIYRYRIQYRRFDGQWQQALNRELIHRPRVAAVLPYDPVLDQVVLIRQFRLGAIQGDRPPWQWEVVAGLWETHTSIEALARQETQEEAGLSINELLPVADYWVSPGGSNERASLFCGLVDASNAGGIWGLDEEHEDIEVRALPSNQAIAGVTEGWIDNATTIIALQWLALNKANLVKCHDSGF